MKTKNIFILLAAISTACCFTACQDSGWETPDIYAPYGNYDISETHVVSIAQLKEMYPKYATDYSCTEMDKEAVLKVYVTGNDVQDNFSNGIAVQDEKGDAMVICVNERSMFSYLPVGQEILVDTKGLCIGGYGAQPQIGTPYKKLATDAMSVSRMPSHVWQRHFKLLPTTHTVTIPEYTVDEFKALDIAANCGKLMKVKNVTITGVSETNPLLWAPAKEVKNNSNCVERTIKEFHSSNYIVYTSSYADFSNDTIPNKKMNLTGIWKRYNNKWELILRDKNDIEVVED